MEQRFIWFWGIYMYLKICGYIYRPAYDKEIEMAEINFI